MQTVKGTEFKNKEFHNLLKTKKIHFFTTENPETKASIVKRFQRTLKKRVWKYFTYHYTLQYVDILPKLVQVTITLIMEVLNVHLCLGLLKMNNRCLKTYMENQILKIFKPKFKVGDFVRNNKTKRIFDKAYLPNWTQELFQILAVLRTQTLITYKLKDLWGELVKGTFYSYELQCVEKDQIYKI